MTGIIDYEARPSGAGGAGPAWGQLQTLLIAGESVRAWSLQHRLYALLHRRHLAAATTGRFIFMLRPLLGGYQPFDVRWQDLKDARLTVGMFSAAITLTYDANQSDTAGGEGGVRELYVSGLEKTSAQALYRECQTEEQAWREKRRVRSIEEMRAQAGGVQVATGVYPQGGMAQPPAEFGGATGGSDDPAQRLARAKAMRDQGLISDSEYEAIKARIVGSL